MRIAQLAPPLLLIYLALLAGQRLAASPFLNDQEAAFFRAAPVGWLSPDGSAPLTDWAMRAALWATEGHWPGAAALVAFGALAWALLFAFDAARRLAGLDRSGERAAPARAGALCLAAAAAAPPLLFGFAQDLSADALALAAAAALAAAFVRVLERPSLGRHAFLGAAAGACALASFWLLPLVAALALSSALSRPLQSAFARPSALAGPAIFAAAAVGPVAAALQDGGGAVATGAVGVAAIGGALAAGVALWAGAPGVAWAVAWRAGRDRAAWASAGARARDAARALARGAAAPLAAAFAIAALSGGGWGEAALGPFAAAILAPIVLAVRYPLGRAAAPIAALGLAMSIAAAPAQRWAFSGGVGAEAAPLAITYERVAAEARRLMRQPSPVLAARAADAANLSLALGWPPPPAGAAAEGGVALMVWRGRRPAPPGLAPAGFAPTSRIVTVVAPLRGRPITETVETGVPIRLQRVERVR